ERASASRINSATAYSNVNRDFSAMAAGSQSDHSPVSVELGRRCGQNGTNDWNSQRQREGAHTIANHESPLMFRFIREAPATAGGHRGFGFRWGEPVMGRETHHLHMFYIPLCI